MHARERESERRREGEGERQGLGTTPADSRDVCCLTGSLGNDRTRGVCCRRDDSVLLQPNAKKFIRGCRMGGSFLRASFHLEHVS